MTNSSPMIRSKLQATKRYATTIRIIAGFSVLGLMTFATACGSFKPGAKNTSSTVTAANVTTTVATRKVPPKRFVTGDVAFAKIPDPIPSGQHGDLLRYQPVKNPPDGVKWFRIMYLSETMSGTPTVETGIITIPNKPTPASGWKLATHAHGSTGLADDCAPSHTIETNPASGAELMVMGADAAKSNYVVASTDYEGQGGPGRHPFLVGSSEGRAVLDAARAARQFPGLKLPRTLAIVGYSQGGHAALWANQVAHEWTPEFDVLGTVAGAPASELSDLITSSAPSIEDNAQAVGILAGFEAADPKLSGPLNKILAPAGKALLAEMDRSCTPSPDFKQGSPLLNADPRTSEPWKHLLAVNTPGSVRTTDPILIIHSKLDQNVPIGQSESLIKRMCAHGQIVERRVLSEGTHVTAAVPAYAQGFAWLDGLAAGKQPKSSCP